MSEKIFNSAVIAQLTYSYYLIGRLEIYFRTQIPFTLSSYSVQKGYFKWHETLPLNTYGELTLEKARRNVNGLLRNELEVANYLPFGFWRYLLSNRQYGGLWLPQLYTLFPNLENPKSLSSFKIVNKHLDSALRLRNNVAHYNLKSLDTAEFSQERVQWILEMTGTQFLARPS